MAAELHGANAHHERPDEHKEASKPETVPGAWERRLAVAPARRWESQPTSQQMNAVIVAVAGVGMERPDRRHGARANAPPITVLRRRVT